MSRNLYTLSSQETYIYVAVLLMAGETAGVMIRDFIKELFVSKLNCLYEMTKTSKNINSWL